ncbi:MAG: phospholipase D-like domain-containing protein, partial [Candidatus Eisenbacteria bacterium]
MRPGPRIRRAVAGVLASALGWALAGVVTAAAATSTTTPPGGSAKTGATSTTTPPAATATGTTSTPSSAGAKTGTTHSRHHRRHHGTTVGPPPGGPPVELVETRPVETTLGNPTLPSATETWLSLIHSARHTIDLEEFYLSTWPEEPTDAVLAALGAAAKRGVKIRLLLDARMYRTYPHVADSLAGVPGWSVRLLPWARIAGGVQHSKYFVIDRTTSFVGSQNLDWRALKHIHELGVRVRDPRVAAELERVFEMDWAEGYRSGTEPDTTRVAHATQVTHPAGTLPLRMTQTPGDTVAMWIGWTPRSFCPDTTWWDRDR